LLQWSILLVGKQEWAVSMFSADVWWQQSLIVINQMLPIAYWTEWLSFYCAEYSQLSEQLLTASGWKVTKCLLEFSKTGAMMTTSNYLPVEMPLYSWVVIQQNHLDHSRIQVSTFMILYNKTQHTTFACMRPVTSQCGTWARQHRAM
jgi:hypothetical protein